jgi:dihydroxyacetone kinase phosphoprotein-dependent L subunit
MIETASSMSEGSRAAAHRMRKFLNDPGELVSDYLAGFAAAHAGLLRYDPQRRIIVRADAPVAGKVGLISAGGSGCEPLHGGFVGQGMLDVACPGEVFTSPVPGQIMAAIAAANGGAGIVQIVKNYPGEVMNFRLVAMDSADQGVQVESVLVNDDVAVADPARRRGLGATVLVEKIAGAAAERGNDLRAVAQIGQRVNERARSFGVGLSSCTVPATGRRIFDLPAGEIELGIGISGEPGTRRAAMRTARELAGVMLDAVLGELQPQAGAHVLLLVNGLGGTPENELYVLYGELDRGLREAGLLPARSLVGNYVTALDQAGASITVLELDDELTALWDAPVHTAALRWGTLTAPRRFTPRVRGRTQRAPARARAATDRKSTAQPPHGVAAPTTRRATEPLIGPNTIALWLTETEREITAQADHLSALDAALGDGDHGTNMRRGFKAVGKAIADRGDGALPGELLMLAGKTLLSTIGGASGALWGLALRRAGRALGTADQIHPIDLAAAVDAMVDAVVELGQASVGEKTLLDALKPAATTLRQELEAGSSLEHAVTQAAHAARAGADATADMEARKGRASFMGARSLGHQDPSANTTAILFSCLQRAVARPGLETTHLTHHSHPHPNGGIR